jgi:hypothetical protein
MKVVCAVCQVVISETDDEVEIVSHGYCEPCYNKEIEKLTKEGS